MSLDAAAVPVRTILSEWGRLGGTKVVGAERIAGAPLTIHLENVTEAQALEVVLRNVGRLHGRAAQRRGRCRRLELRPDPGDADQRRGRFRGGQHGSSGRRR